MLETASLTSGYHAVPDGHVAAVVTYLEMKGPPPDLQPDPPAPVHGVTLERWAGAEIQPGEYRQLFQDVGSDWLWFSRLTLSDADLMETILAPGHEVYVAKRNDETIGLLELNFRKAPDVDLAFFGLVGSAMGQGLGRWLMLQALARVWDPSRALQSQRLSLQTCTFDSPAALPFYLRSGFTAYARAVEIAPDPRLSGTLGPGAAPQVPVLKG